MTDLVAGDTCDLPATAVRWVGEAPPGLGGHENLVPEAAYPVPVDIRCDVTAVAGNIATVRATRTCSKYRWPRSDQ